MRLFLTLVSLSFVLAVPALARDPQISLREGTEKTGLTEDQRNRLVDFLKDTHRDLERTLQKGRELTLEQAEAYYSQVLTGITVASGDRKPLDELISRIALNQGKETAELASQSLSAGLAAVILERSIELALRFIGGDTQAFQRGDFKTLPYLEFGLDRLQSCTYWIAQVQEGVLRDQIAYGCVQHFVAVIALSQDARAESLRVGRPLIEMDDLVRGQQAAEPRPSLEGSALRLRAWAEELFQKDQSREISAPRSQIPQAVLSEEKSEPFNTSSFDLRVPPTDFNALNFGVSGRAPEATFLVGSTLSGGNGESRGALTGFTLDGSCWWGEDQRNQSRLIVGGASRIQMLFAPQSGTRGLAVGDGTLAPLLGVYGPTDSRVRTAFLYKPFEGAFARDTRLSANNFYSGAMLVGFSFGLQAKLVESDAQQLTLEASASGSMGAAGSASPDLMLTQLSLGLGGHVEGEAALSWENHRFRLSDRVRINYFLTRQEHSPGFLSLENHATVGVKSTNASRIGMELGYLLRRNSLEHVRPELSHQYPSTSVMDHFFTMGIKFK